MKECIFKKKGFTILLSILLLAGCSSEGANQPKTETDDATKVVQPEVNPESSDTVIKDKNETEETDNIGTTNVHLKDFIEFDVLADKIDLDIYRVLSKQVI